MLLNLAQVVFNIQYFTLYADGIRKEFPATTYMKTCTEDNGEFKKAHQLLTSQLQLEISNYETGYLETQAEDKKLVLAAIKKQNSEENLNVIYIKMITELKNLVSAENGQYI